MTPTDADRERDRINRRDSSGLTCKVCEKPLWAGNKSGLCKEHVRTKSQPRMFARKRRSRIAAYIRSRHFAFRAKQ